jgi:hypothetical protein
MQNRFYRRIPQSNAKTNAPKALKAQGRPDEAQACAYESGTRRVRFVAAFAQGKKPKSALSAAPTTCTANLHTSFFDTVGACTM